MSCRIAFAAAASIGCVRRFGNKTLVFDQKDIRAVVKSSYTGDPSRLESFAFLGAGGAAITGAIFVARMGTIALVGAIPLAIAGAVFVMGSIYLLAAAEHHPDALLYSADGAQLSDLK